MDNVFAGAGWFLLPLGLCSLFAVYIIVERLLALRPSKVLPRSVVEAFLVGRLDTAAYADGEKSTAGRIFSFYHNHRPDPDALKAFAMLEITKMERGIFLLDVVVAGAPLIGLLGTVTGLVHVFGGIDVGGGLPDSAIFTQGIALALSTTMLGLTIAIPTLLASGYLYRRVDLLSAQLNVGVERLIDLALAREVAEELAQGGASGLSGSASTASGTAGGSYAGKGHGVSEVPESLGGSSGKAPDGQR